MEGFIVYLVVTLTIGGAVGYVIGCHTGRPFTGYVLGATLFVVGWLAAACVPTTPAELAQRRRADALRTPADRAGDPAKRLGIFLGIAVAAAWLSAATVSALMR